ncbi:hypothetical protein like AT2G19180 [Hibiscus trionum]|uniref:Uncharacterized protein n=1 Tax=Hibiscus trionum TaxID=183268 RepID=A0A9W7HVM8_HIBTR|nr:hypothetical protein like AT2G19180 [Hibiscus trionum]
MARMLSKTLLPSGSVLHHRSSFLRRFSSKPELFEIVLDSTSSSDSTINKMEEIIHAIIVQKSTPDWLPFLPGSSFWVPLPHRGSKPVSHFIDQLTNQLTPDEYLSLTTGRGWPCASFFVSDGEYTDAKLKNPEQEEEDDEEEVKVEILIDSDDNSS